jgi:xylan 1,4-beta-xylosidase
MPQTVLASFDSRAKAYETLALGKPATLNIDLAGLKPGAKVLVETLDKQNGNAMGVWESLGKPENPTREQTKQLREKAAATKQEHFTADANGSFKLQRSLEPWSVVLVRELS